MPLLRIAPEMPVKDLRESVAYYTGRLGFVLASEMGDYAIVERDGIAIHLFAAGSGVSPVGVHVFTDGLEVVHGELLSGGASVSQGIERKPWGNREFRVRDPFGNELKFTEPIVS